MAVIWWGTHVFNSNKGFHSEKVACPDRGRVYAPAYVKSNFWFHIEFIPLIPYKSMYRKFCPVCGMKTEAAPAEPAAEVAEPEAEPGAVTEFAATEPARRSSRRRPR